MSVLPERPLPSSKDDERALLAALLQSEEAWHNLAISGFAPEMLHFASHRILHGVLAELHGRGIHGDAVLLLSTLMERKLVDDIGGAPVPSELFGEFAPAAHVPHYVERIRATWQARQAFALGERIARLALSADEELRGAVTTAAAEISLLFVQRAPNVVPISDAVAQTISAMEAEIEGEAVKGMPTGFAEWDAELGGLHRDLCIIGGETSSGKSALCLQLLSGLLERGRRGLLFSLEMNRDVVVRRLLCLRSGLQMHTMMDIRGMVAGDFQRLTFAQTAIANAPLTISDDPDLTIDDIRGIARAQAAIEPLDVIVVDYLQLVTAKLGPQANREQTVSHIAMELKKMAEELQCCVISPTQINDDGKIRESRAIGMHAATVVLIREDCLFVSKNRHGRRGQALDVTFDGPSQQFVRNNHGAN